ncbi:MAG: aminotransferase class V-fold PLP-dependent enzyme [Rectinema subterraneum]|uniref:aminotransferase class V-fold PLP-dependent enzyme n=1 Tax=Rectinema subterraneum TaxID=2653714 RepID=UPI003C7DF87B
MKTTFSALAEGADISINAAVARELKKEYPIFRTLPNLVYLDNAATTQKPLSVLDAERDFYMQSCANVHRAIHTIGEEATARYEKARSSMARFIGAAPKELIFTRGTTESINLVVRTFGETLREGDEIILSVMEHHANMVPWQQLAERRGVVLKFIPVTDLGELDLAEYEKLVSPKTRLVAVTMVSNVLGTINPIDRIVATARSAGVPVLLDAAQAAPSMPLDVKALGADFVAFSGHKMYGPFGIGILWGSETMLDSMPPFLGGGDMISEVRLEGFSVNELPYKFEAGTPPIAQAIGLEAAAEWLSSVGLEALGEYESALARRFLNAIKDIPGLRVMGNARQRAGIVAFTLENAHAHDVAAYLDRRGIAVRAGHHCAHPLARRFGVVSSARASFGAYNLPEDADAAARALADAQEAL